VLFFLLAQLSGCAILAVGFWLILDPSVVRMASVVHVSLVVNDSFIMVVATLFIALGIFALLVGLCGCCGAVRESKLLLSLVSLHAQPSSPRAPQGELRRTPTCRVVRSPACLCSGPPTFATSCCCFLFPLHYDNFLNQIFT